MAGGIWLAGGRVFARHSEFACCYDLTEVVSGFFGSKESAELIGNAYLLVNPGGTYSSLLEGLLPGLSDCDRYHVGQNRLRLAIMSRMRIDYEIERVVNLDGWILSETEARLCALVSLSCDGKLDD